MTDPRGDTLTRDELRDFLTSATRIAVVGLSSKPHRPSHGVARRLIDLGYDIVPVNPNEVAVHGIAAVASLHDVEGDIDIVDVFRRPEYTPQVARDAVAVGARMLWLQQGVTSTDARRIATELGLAYVEDECLGVTAGQLLATP